MAATGNRVRDIVVQLEELNMAINSCGASETLSFVIRNDHVSPITCFPLTLTIISPSFATIIEKSAETNMSKSRNELRNHWT